jgi:outer membrane protein OmpA-like peptidoglycan-associated protein
VVECNRGPYVVFFDWDMADITPEAATVLDSMVSAYAYCSGAPLAVDGYTDLSGSDRYNQGLSERRAEAVRGYLTARSLADEAITTTGYGESNPRVPTEDGVRELQNRRVEITVK